MNLNSATVDDLITLKGIGPAKAKAIVEYRSSISAFTSLEQLLQVKGISQRTLDSLSSQISLTTMKTKEETPLNSFTKDMRNMLPAATKIVTPKKDIVRIGFNPGILNIKDHQKLNSLSWPRSMLTWLQEPFSNSLPSGNISETILHQKESFISSSISEEDVNTFITQMTGNFSSPMEQSVHLYTWSDAGIHVILNTALNSNRKTYTGKTIQGWEVIIYNMIQYIKQGKGSQLSKRLPQKVYRGCNATSSEIDFYVTGDCSFAWKGFISTSSQFDVALSFALDACARRRVSPVVFEIEVNPLCQSAVEIADLSYYPCESEILFLPGSAFQVLDVMDKEDYVHIRCVQIVSPLHIKKEGK